MSKAHRLELIGCHSAQPITKRAHRRPAAAPAGFTLPELTAALGIAGVVLALGAPVLSDLHADARVKTAASDFAASLRMARSHALTQHVSTQVVPSGAAWHDGWRVRSGDALLLDRSGPLRIDVVANDTTALVYARNGALAKPEQHAFAFQAPGHPAVAVRCVLVGSDGRPSVQLATTRSACPIH